MKTETVTQKMSRETGTSEEVIKEMADVFIETLEKIEQDPDLIRRAEEAQRRYSVIPPKKLIRQFDI